MPSGQEPESIWRDGISLRRIAGRYRGKVAVTWSLLLVESLLSLLFPLAIGYTVDTLIAESWSGLLALAALSVAVMIVGAGRRFYDTRAYSVIYRDLGNSLVAREREKDTPTTKVSARVGLLYEVVEFFEDSLPSLIGGVIEFVGVIILIAWIDPHVALASLVASLLVIIVYAVSERRIFAYNKNQNDELEQQVTVLAEKRKRRLDVHFRRIIKWNIKLSDLETLNFSIVWLVMAGLLLVSIVLIVANDAISYGQKITTIMYVFGYIEVVMTFPLYYQQFVRLKEITRRLSGATDETSPAPEN